jgi:hypothetical protein
MKGISKGNQVLIIGFWEFISCVMTVGSRISGFWTLNLNNIPERQGYRELELNSDNRLLFTPQRIGI